MTVEGAFAPAKGYDPGAEDPWRAVVGQGAATGFLRGILRRGRLHHAYLFAGPAGVGKTTAARIFGQTLLCPQGSDTGVYCGMCPSCRRFAAGTHPDFLQVEPEGKTIGVAGIRSLQGWIALRPGLSGRRVVVLEPAEAMSDVAQNALLKTLEEPPGGSVLLLISHGGEGVLPTLVSRCQRVRFVPVPMAAMEELVRERRPEYGAVARLIAALADGRPGWVLERDWEAVLARREELIRLLADWPTSNPLGALRLAAQWDRLDDGDLAISMDLLQFLMRDLLVLQEYPRAAGELLVNGDRDAALRQQAARWPAGRLMQAQEAFARAREYMTRHVNRRLNLDVLLLRISQP